ncbi:MAG: hypothetical protein RLZ04_1188 [Actinomycetota bacterium]
MARRPCVASSTRTHGPGLARGGRVGTSDGSGPHFASVVAGTLPRVSTNHTPDHDGQHPDEQARVEEAYAAMQQARARLADTPVEIMVQNHVMGLYELAAIHLSAEPPRLHDAALAIDAVGCLVEGLGPRLGEEHVTLTEALSNIRLAFVQIKGLIAEDDAPGAPRG